MSLYRIFAAPKKSENKPDPETRSPGFLFARHGYRDPLPVFYPIPGSKTAYNAARGAAAILYIILTLCRYTISFLYASVKP